MEQNLYRVSVCRRGGLLYQIKLFDRQGALLGSAVVNERDDVPESVLMGLRDLDQRFVGSLPDAPGAPDDPTAIRSPYQEYWVVTEPIVREKRLVDIGAEMDRRNI